MNRNELNAVFQLLKIAAEQGYVDAQYNLGVCYYNGDGVKQDYYEAFRWYKAAAEQGYAKAQCNLGLCYKYGDGVEKDFKEAYYWYLIAYRNGYTDALKDVKSIENKLTYQQKQEVQKRVNDWFKTHPKEQEQLKDLISSFNYDFYKIEAYFLNSFIRGGRVKTSLTLDFQMLIGFFNN